MRRFLSLLGLVGLAACSNDDDPYLHEPNEIVFGISQSFGADGVPHIEADYGFLGLARQPFRYRPWVFTDGDGNSACYYERFDEASQHAPSDPGVAVFSGGKLPGAGIAIAANPSGATTVDGSSWASSDVLTFHASGFAMPGIDGVQLYAPTTALEVTSVAPASAISAVDDVTVSWTPTTGEDTRVMVALDTDAAPAGAGAEIRCFTGGSYGRAVIPHAWVAKLFSSFDASVPITGHLRVATHSQVTVAAPKNWLVYVVATSIHHDSVFTGSRN